MTDILTEIIACKQIEIELQKAAISKEMLINNCNEPMPRISMRASLASSPYGIISEFKRRSPSKGWIKEDAQADTIPPAYEAAGASALSILTDEKYFGGSLKDIRSARPHVQLPILRKDFIIDEYQLYQARIVGADAILLIAAALKKEQCKALALKAHELELEVLLEIHNEQELEYIDENIDMVGVNNRNLGTFHTEVENSFRLAEKLPEEMLRISESGISSPKTVKQSRLPTQEKQKEESNKEQEEQTASLFHACMKRHCQQNGDHVNCYYCHNGRRSQHLGWQSIPGIDQADYTAHNCTVKGCRDYPADCHKKFPAYDLPRGNGHCAGIQIPAAGLIQRKAA